MDAKEFYEKQLKAFGHDPDYGAMDQGPEGTRQRHMEFIRYLNGPAMPRMETIIDVGCGTGLLLDTLAEFNRLPKLYIGLDMMPERREHVELRARKWNVQAEFWRGDVRNWDGRPMTILDSPHKRICVAAVGLVGHEPFHSLNGVCQFMEKMMKWGQYRFMTLPRPYKNMLGHPNQMHFQPSDMHTMLTYVYIGPYYSMTECSEREFSICW